MAKVRTRKRIGLVAHDNNKKDMVEWVAWNYSILHEHELVCTGTTGRLVQETLENLVQGRSLPRITKLKSGPLGGDQQLGAMIVNGDIDILFFFWDPMASQPHDVDVKALLRIVALYNIPTACNRATADFIISSNLFHDDYEPVVKDYSAYIKRSLD